MRLLAYIFYNKKLSKRQFFAFAMQKSSMLWANPKFFRKNFSAMR